VASKKRKQYIINQKLQFQIIGVFLLSVVLALVIFTGATVGFYWVSGMTGENLFREYLTIYRQVDEVKEVARDGQMVKQKITTTREIPGVKRWELIVPALVVNNLLILLMILIMGLFYSHKIAGPLYRIQTDLARALEGSDQVRIVTRKRDKLEELVLQLNLLLEELDRLRASREEK